MLSIMQTVSPKDCELIINGKKSAIITKTKPNIDKPFLSHLYCQKHRARNTSYCGHVPMFNDHLYRLINGQIKYGYSGEVMCQTVDGEIAPVEKWGDWYLNGRVVAQIICDRIDTYNTSWLDGEDNLLERTALNDEEIMDYMDSYTDRRFYIWNISDVRVFTESKLITEFTNAMTLKSLTRAPASWCYIATNPFKR